MAELLLDPDIRFWVFLPIIIITFLTGIIRHYVTLLLSSEKKSDLVQITDSHAIIRARMLRENGKYLPRQAFLMRKHFFNGPDGFFQTQQRREAAPKNPMADPSMMTDMLKGNLTNVLPMIVIGSWINWAFSGFLTTKVPFPLTLRFKPMLQRGVELASLDAAWVSSASWYFLNVFGLRSVYNLILGQDNAADQTRIMQDQMAGGGMPGMAGPAGGGAAGQDPAKAFKAEWEALELCSYEWALEGVEHQLLISQVSQSSDFEQTPPTTPQSATQHSQQTTTTTGGSCTSSERQPAAAAPSAVQGIYT